MTNKKPDLYSIEQALIEKYPAQSIDKFVLDTKSGITPSKALQNFIKDNLCAELDSSVIIDLLRQAYPGIDIGQISGLIHDAGYPFGSLEDMSDVEFDTIVIRAHKNPPEW